MCREHPYRLADASRRILGEMVGYRLPRHMKNPFRQIAVVCRSHAAEAILGPEQAIHEDLIACLQHRATELALGHPNQPLC